MSTQDEVAGVFRTARDQLDQDVHDGALSYGSVQAILGAAERQLLTDLPAEAPLQEWPERTEQDLRVIALEQAVRTWSTREARSGMPADAVTLAASKYLAFLQGGGSDGDA